MPGYVCDKNPLGFKIMEGEFLYSRQENISYSLFLLFLSDFKRRSCIITKNLNYLMKMEELKKALENVKFFETEASLCVNASNVLQLSQQHCQFI